jgi:hypothetical protein
MDKPRGRPFEPGNQFGRGRRKGSRNRPKCGDDLLDKCLSPMSENHALNTPSRLLHVALLLSLYAAGSYGQQADSQPIQFRRAAQTVVEDRLRTYTRKNRDREPAVKRLFEAAGCKGDALTEQPVKGVKWPNVICTFSGAEDSTIIVGAHFDLVETGSGVVDNWTGASLLSSLYEGLAGTPRKHTFLFVAFTAEESGLLGSRAFVKELGDHRNRIKAAVIMDSLGLSDTKIWTSHSDQDLVRIIAAVAGAANLPIAGVNVDEVGTTDSEPFRQQKIPSITLHSVTQDTLSILHSPSDQMGAVRIDAYYRSYELIQEYLAVLDQKLD